MFLPVLYKLTIDLCYRFDFKFIVMELCEVSAPYFSQWVQSSLESRKLYREDSRTSKTSRKTSRTSRSSTSSIGPYYNKGNYSEDEFKETLQKWLEYPEHDETDKLKKLIRRGVLLQLRSQLWKDASGGADIILNSPHYYEEMIDDMGKIDIISVNNLPWVHEDLLKSSSCAW